MQENNIGVLLCNLGTPEQPTSKAVAKFLGQFLADQRVVELPPWFWKCVLNGIIIPFRSPKTAEKYRKIWTSGGSPLLVWTRLQTQLLQEVNANNSIKIDFAFTYGSPSIATKLNHFVQFGVNKILVIPLYPQYSCSATAPIFDQVGDWMKGLRYIPEFRFINHYYDHPLYIKALARNIRRAGDLLGSILVLSFHGTPEKLRELGDPYYRQCLVTSELLTKELALSEAQVRVCFQSRFGKNKWLTPSTENVLKDLANSSADSVVVACPGFVSDCLETIEEISIGLQEMYEQLSGKKFTFVDCLNDSFDWITALNQMIQQHTKGWSLGD